MNWNKNISIRRWHATTTRFLGACCRCQHRVRHQTVSIPIGPFQARLPGQQKTTRMPLIPRIALVFGIGFSGTQVLLGEPKAIMNCSWFPPKLEWPCCENNTVVLVFDSRATVPCRDRVLQSLVFGCDRGLFRGICNHCQLALLQCADFARSNWALPMRPGAKHQMKSGPVNCKLQRLYWDVSRIDSPLLPK